MVLQWMTMTNVSKETCIRQKRPAKETCKRVARNGDTQRWRRQVCPERSVYTKRDLQKRRANERLAMVLHWMTTTSVSKETCIHQCVKRNLYAPKETCKRDLQKRPTKKRLAILLRWSEDNKCGKRTLYTPKETCKGEVCAPKETCQRDLQKRPTKKRLAILCYTEVTTINTG